MDNLSHFIHEELFILGEAKSTTSELKSADSKKYTLGVVANTRNEDDKKLLTDILRAIKLDFAEITFEDSVSSNSDRWVVFADSLDMEGAEWQPTRKILTQSSTILLAHPLEVLRDSKQEKGALWLILKEEFSL